MFDIESCYVGGYLDKALNQAAEFIKKIGEAHVRQVVAYLDTEDAGWYVDVVYEKE